MNEIAYYLIKALMASTIQQSMSHRISIIVDARTKLKPIIPSIDVILSLAYSVDNNLTSEELDLYNILNKEIVKMDVFKSVVQGDMFFCNQTDFYLIDYIKEALFESPSNQFRTLLFHTILLVFSIDGEFAEEEEKTLCEIMNLFDLEGYKIDTNILKEYNLP